MHRRWSAAVLVAIVQFGFTVLALGGPSDALDRAQALLTQNDAKGAIRVLEDALPTAAGDRPGLLDALRRAYEAAIRQASAAGKENEAEIFRDNLEILNRRTPARAANAPEASVSAPAAAPLPSQSLAPAPAHTAAPEPVPAALAPAHDAPVQQASSSGGIPVGVPQAAQEIPAPLQNRDPDVSASGVGVPAADAAFNAKRWEEAGQMYATLAQEKRLPASRRDHWAYCRCVEVVRRINAKPKSAQEWDSIDAEIKRIRELSPNMWFSEYLRNRAAERQSGRRVSQSNKIIVRGSAPEEPLEERAPARPVNRRAQRLLAQADPAPAAESIPTTPKGPAPVGNWQIRETDSFRIFHADPALAERVAQIAEATRENQVRRWSGTAPRTAWSPRCDIYVYPSAAIFSQMTGQPEESPGFSTMGMNAGRIVARRINARADHPNLIGAILPHEITHVVLADLFPEQQVPRWADEGMAVLSEPVAEQRVRAADLEKPLSSGRVFKLHDLTSMDYPDGKFWAVYYAQSVSLTRFLVEQGTPAQFVRFIQGAQQNGVEAELRRAYQIEGFADLERKWLAYAKARSSESAAVAEDPPGGRETQRR